jgi:hypothetical protein
VVLGQPRQKVFKTPSQGTKAGCGGSYGGKYKIKITVQANLGKKGDLISKITKAQRTAGMAKQ